MESYRDIVPAVSTPSNDGPDPGPTVGQRVDAALATLRQTSSRVPVLLVGVYVLAVGWLVAPGGLYIDDIRAQAYAADRAIWPFIIESNRTHLAPGPRTVDWLMAQYAPLQHGPAVVLSLAIAGGLGTSVWLVIRELTDRVLAAALGTALILASPGLVPSAAWFRQALTTHVAVTLGLLAVWATLRSLRKGPSWLAFAPVLLLPLAYCFSERAVLFTILIAWIHLVGARGSWRTRLRRSLPVAVPLVVVTVLFLVAYSVGDFDTLDKGDPGLGHFAASTGRSLFKNTIPALLGGPLIWRAESGPYSFASTPVVHAVLACLAFFGLIAWRLRQNGARQRLLAVAAPVAIFVLAVYVLLYLGRVSRAEVISVDDLRLHPDIVIALGVLLAVALDTVPAPRSRRFRTLTFLLIGAVLVLDAVSWARFGSRWHSNTSSEYIETMRSELEADPGPAVLPGGVPPSIVPWWVQPDFSTEPLTVLMSPSTPTALVNGPERMISETGEAQPARIAEVSSSRQSDAFCPAAVVHEQAILALNEPSSVTRGALVRAGVLAADSTVLEVGVLHQDGRITMAQTVRPIAVQRGPHTIVVPVPQNADVRGVVLRKADPDVGVCLVEAAVGTLEVDR